LFSTKTRVEDTHSSHYACRTKNIRVVNKEGMNLDQLTPVLAMQR